MLQEVGLQGLQEAPEAVAYKVQPFQIDSQETYDEWMGDIWPRIQTLFDTTWPGSSGPDNAEFFENVLQQDDAAVIMMRGREGRMLGVSFIYPLEFYQPTPDEFGHLESDNAAYNSSVIVDPKYRSQGLVIPLIEETLGEASALGYEYVVGRYNASTGTMPDGRNVRRGFADRLKNHNWENAEIVEPTIPSHAINSRGETYPVEHIAFRLHAKQRLNGTSARRTLPN